MNPVERGFRRLDAFQRRHLATAFVFGVIKKYGGRQRRVPRLQPGNGLKTNITALHRNSSLGLTVGLLGTVWGSVGLAENGIFTMMQVWNLPGIQRPNYPKRLVRGLGSM